MVARLEGDERFGACGTVAGEPQSHRLGVLRARPLVPAFADDAAVADQHAADERIG